MNEKIIITQEMVDSFADMIKSSNAEDVKFASNVLEMRDKTDQVSEENFKKLADLIIDDDKLFPASHQWVIKIGGKRIVLNNDKASWRSKEQAERALSVHLTNYLGKSYKNTILDAITLNIIRWKTTSPQEELNNINEFLSKDKSNYLTSSNPPYHLRRPNGKEYIYDPNFDKKEFIRKEKEKLCSDVGDRAKWGWSQKNIQYFKAMKMVFNGGKELRDFLIKNKIVEIVQA